MQKLEKFMQHPVAQSTPLLKNSPPVKLDLLNIARQFIVQNTVYASGGGNYVITSQWWR